jgi:hypothetical protein
MQVTCTIAEGNFKGILNPDRTSPEGLDGQAKILGGARWGSKIENVIYMPRIKWPANILLQKLKAWFVRQMSQVFAVTRGEVIDAHNLMAFAQ